MIDRLVSWLQNMGILALDRLLPFLLILVGGILLIRLVMAFVTKALEKSKLEKAAHGLIISVVRVLLYSLLALIAASKLGIDVTGIVALASVASLALSLALQNSLTNLIGGFVLLYTKPFSSGDYVEIAGQAGTVESIGMAYTKLLTPDNKLISIPNSSVVAAQIVNYTVTGKRRVDVNVSVAYASQPEKVLAALTEAGKVDYALEDPALFVGITGYDQSAINYTLRIWTTADDYWDAWFLMNKRVGEIFQREDLKMVYPIMNVRMEKE